MRPLTAVLCTLLLAPAALASQTVHGQVRESGSNTPVRGSFVVLLDETGRRRVGLLTDSAGRYVIRAPAPGAYRLRVETLGYESVLSDPFTLALEEVRTLSLETRVNALRLPEISVSANQRCVSNPQNAVQTARVWEEIRKALSVAAWLENEGAASFRVRTFDQQLNKRMEAVEYEQMLFRLVDGKRAFRALSADSLSQLGFVQRQGDQFSFFGPDAELLISPEFLDQHCFRLQRSPAPGLLGLAFQPMRGRRVSDIEGTLWIDEKSGELRFLDYRFTNVGFSLDDRFANGRTDFQRLANGAWIVSRWVMTTPVLDESTLRWSLRTTGARLQGGEVLDARIGDAPPMELVPSFRVSGFVHDSLRGKPLANARVYLAGTPLETFTDAHGRFTLDSVPRGQYFATVAHPRFDSLPAPPPFVRLRVDSLLAPLLLATPSAEPLRARFCTEEEMRRIGVRQKVPAAQLGVVRVDVVDDETGEPLSGVQVRLNWNAEVPILQGIATGPRQLETRTNDRGQATFCGVDTHQSFTIDLRTDHLNRTGPFRLPPERIVRLLLKMR